MDNIEKLARKNILSLKPYTSARSSHLNGILMDANENAYGSVVENNLELNRYPDPGQTKLRNVIGDYLDVQPDKIFCGVGSDEIIDLLVRIFCEPAKDEVILLEPTYGMYKVVCDINNIKTNTLPLTKDFQINLEEFYTFPKDNCKMVFICSPNNPTGNMINKDDIISLAQKFEGIVIVDQAYVDFTDEEELLSEIEEVPNLVLLRTFSKAWGLAGVRFGFSISNKSIVNLLMKVKAPYTINKLTESVILSAISNAKQKDEFVQSIREEKERVFAELRRIEIVKEVYESDANFILFKVDDADKVYNDLAKKNIIIRNRSTQLGLEGCLRVTIGTPEENDKFLTELKNIA